jgi:hypothetical protein
LLVVSSVALVRLVHYPLVRRLVAVVLSYYVVAQLVLLWAVRLKVPLKPVKKHCCLVSQGKTCPHLRLSIA